MNSQTAAQNSEPALSWLSEGEQGEPQIPAPAVPSRSVAHEMNNLMNIVTGYCELLAIEVGADPSLQRKISEIEKAAHRAIDLTHELLQSGRDSKT